MSLTSAAIRAGEGIEWPDPMLRAAVRYLVGRTSRKLAQEDPASDIDFARRMDDFPIALSTEAANAQHYEVPAELFRLMLGPQRKYSCCYYVNPDDTLAQAEENALAETARHADLSDGQHILELGCGWGSLSLWMARHYPAARITAVSNSHSQRMAIEEIARTEALANLSVITADMNSFVSQDRFDRVVSVEMFEHMSNWRALLQRVVSWLSPDGLLFLHVFSHRDVPYRFDPTDKADWIAQHFFTGGIMPNHGLIRQLRDVVEVVLSWWWSANHYRRTAEDWLATFDRNLDKIAPVLRQTYGADAEIWQRRWRLFLLATSGLFGHSNGLEWGVSHHRLRRAR